MRENTFCKCFEIFEVELGRPSEYKRAKNMLNRGHHPAFIGQETYETYASNGGGLFIKIKNEDIAICICNPRTNSLIALNVDKSHRGHGLGKAIVEYINPSFARVSEDKIPFFEKIGFIKIGSLKEGRKIKTAIMIKKRLFEIVGKLGKVLERDE